MKNIALFIVLLFFALGKIPAQNADVTICTKLWCNGAVIADVDFGLDPGTSFDPITGCATFEDVIPLDSNYLVAPAKDNDLLNGVNALDIIHIVRHILGLEPLGSPYAMIAADANKSNSITSFDVVALKRLIQGIDTALLNNISWRFVDANFLFPNPANPFQEPGPDSLIYTFQDSTYYYDFLGIKTGDVDCSAYPGFAPSAEERSTATLTLPDAALKAGETLELPLRMAEPGTWLGLQLGLRYDPNLVEIEAVVPGNLPGMDESAIAQPRPGLLNVVWFDTGPQVILPDENLLTLRVRALRPVRLSEAISVVEEKLLPEAYTAWEETRQLELRFTERSAAIFENAVFLPQPNPTTAGATIPLRLSQPETVTLALADIFGKRLWSEQITRNAGAHLLEIPASALVQKGVYVWRVQAGKMTESGKLVKM